MEGLDLLGALVGATYTDSATVKAVQRALKIDVDGKIGPQTRGAVKAFNDKLSLEGGESITDATLVALGLTAQPPEPVKAAPVMATAFMPQPSTAMVPAAAADQSIAGWFKAQAWPGGWPRWQVAAVAGGGVVGLGTLLIALVGGGTKTAVKP